MLPIFRFLLATLAAQLLFAASAWGAIKASLEADPNPPTSGENSFVLTLTDEKGTPVAGATVEALIFMPAMGSMPRMEARGKTVEKAPGRYLISYPIPMDGTWEVALAVKTGQEARTLNYSLTTGVKGLIDKTMPSKSSSAGGTGSQPESNLLPLGPARLQKIGVRFARVETKSLSKTLRIVGTVESDDTRRVEVAPRFAGFVEKQFKGRLGDAVRAGTPLLTLYSPDLVAAQSEFLLTAQTTGANHSLHQAAADKLGNLGFSAPEIASIKRTGVPKKSITLVAPQAGTLLEINAREGSAVQAGQVLYVVGDLTKTYIVGLVFQRDVADVKIGAPIDIIMPEGNTERLRGAVDFIYPSDSESAGTVRVRVRALRYSRIFRPGLFLDLRLPIDFGRRLVVPTSSILYSGEHRYVFRHHGEGVLEPVEVTTGKTDGEHVEVTAGLSEGESIVASGTFLLGSEAQLRNALPKWKRPKNEKGEASSQEGHTHD